MRRQKIYSFNNLAGCVTQFKSQATGTIVGVYHAVQSGMETADSDCRWISVCEKHNTLVCHSNLADALRTRDPREFCDECREGK